MRVAIPLMLFVLSTPLLGGTKPGAPTIPGPVLAAIAADLTEADERVAVKRQRQAVKATNIDADGMRDWSVDWGAPGFPGWCGTGGCRYQLWRGMAGGSAQLVFDTNVRSVSTRRANGEIVFDFDFHGSTCGTFGASECLVSFAWDAKAGRMVERVNPHGDGTVRYVAPVEEGMKGYPEAVDLTIKDQIKFCAAMGAKPDAASDEGLLPASVPDVDGDGQRDWLFNGQSCGFADGRESVPREDAMLITAGNPDKPELFAPGGRLEVSVTTVPASFAQIDSKAGNCVDGYAQPNEKPCPRIPWRWDAEKRQPVRR